MLLVEMRRKDLPVQLIVSLPPSRFLGPDVNCTLIGIPRYDDLRGNRQKSST